MNESQVVYLLVTPASRLPQALERTVDTNPDAILLGAYDSGRIRLDLVPQVRRATEKGIPVFGISQTLFYNFKVALPVGKAKLDDMFEIQERALSAGLVPLQAIPTELIGISEEVRKVCDLYEGLTTQKRRFTIDIIPEHRKGIFSRSERERLETYRATAPPTEVSEPVFPIFGEGMFNYIIGGLNEICRAHYDYQSKVDAARERFSTPEFNKRIDDALANNRQL